MVILFQLPHVYLKGGRHLIIIISLFDDISNVLVELEIQCKVVL